MEIRIPDPSRQPNPSVFFSNTVRQWNECAEKKFGTASFGRYVDYEGKILRGGLILDKSVLRETRKSVTYRVKLSAITGSPAARQSTSGRNGPWACWYTFRDFLFAVFDEYPDAAVRTMLGTYKSQDDFLAKFPGTWYGTGHSPYFGELCHNLGWHDQHDRRI